MRKSIWKTKKGDGDDVRMKYLSFLFLNRKYKKIKKMDLFACVMWLKSHFFSLSLPLSPYFPFFFRLLPCFVISLWAVCGTKISKKRLLCSPGLTPDKSDFLL